MSAIVTDPARLSIPSSSDPPPSAATEDAPPALPESQDSAPSAAGTLVVLQAAQLALLFTAALYLTRPIILPIVLAVILKLLLQSGVRRLERIYVPRALAALLMIT